MSKLEQIHAAFNYNKSDIARAACVQRQAVYNWFRRGKISASGAAKLRSHDKITSKDIAL